VLSIYDDIKKRVVDMEVTWERGFDTDAKMSVSVRFKKEWALAVKILRQDSRDVKLRPYPTLSVGVNRDKITKSATGFYALAREIWSGVGWRIAPPYPGPEKTEEGAVL